MQDKQSIRERPDKPDTREDEIIREKHIRRKNWGDRRETAFGSAMIA